MTEKLVYFMRPIGQLGPIKIGCSKEPESRLATLAIQSPVRLEIVAAVPGTHADERRLHGMFAAHWLHHEWFAASKALLALLDYVVTHGELPALPEGKVVRLPRQKRCGVGAGGKRPPSQKTVAFGAKLRADYESGLGLYEIAEREGRAVQTVRRALDAAGVAIRPRGNRQRPKGVDDQPRAEEFRRRYQGGETLQQIGEAFGVTRERVRQILRKTEVPSLGYRKEHCRQPHPLTAAEIEAARLYDEGKTRPIELAERFGLTTSQLHVIVKRCGYRTKGKAEWARLFGSDDVTEKVVSLYREGKGSTEIAHLMPEVKQPTRVYWHLRRAGIAPRRKMPPRQRIWDCSKEAGQATAAKVLDMRAQGLAPKVIAERVGVNINTVYKHLHDARQRRMAT